MKELFPLFSYPLGGSINTHSKFFFSKNHSPCFKEILLNIVHLKYSLLLQLTTLQRKLIYRYHSCLKEETKTSTNATDSQKHSKTCDKKTVGKTMK